MDTSGISNETPWGEGGWGWGGLQAATIFLVAMCFAWGLFHAPFNGEDELLVLDRAGKLIEALRVLDWRAVAQITLQDYNPPARVWLVLPGVKLLGPTSEALRFPNGLLWACACACAARLASRLAGLSAGWLAGLLLAGSGLFNLYGMGFGHAGEVLFPILLLSLFVGRSAIDLTTPEGVRRYALGGALLVIGFLFFTSLLPVAAAYHVLVFREVLRRSPHRARAIRRYGAYSLPFLLFYAAYYLVFIGVPAWVLHERIGQWHQNKLRSEMAGLNVRSLVENLCALNWYVMPVLPVAVLIAGLYEMRRRCPLGFWSLLPYGLVFCFYIQGMTGVHFFAVYCWAVPFAVAWYLRVRSGSGCRKRGLAAGVVIVLVWSLSYVGHVRLYTRDDYPERLRTALHGLAYWQNNVRAGLP